MGCGRTARGVGWAGPDDIRLADLFKPNTRILTLYTQVITAVVVATSLLMDVEMALKAIDGGAISGETDLTTSINLELESTRFPATGNTVMHDFGAAVEGTNDRIINLELTKTGAVSGDTHFLVAALIGRTDY